MCIKDLDKLTLIWLFDFRRNQFSILPYIAAMKNINRFKYGQNQKKNHKFLPKSLVHMVLTKEKIVLNLMLISFMDQKAEKVNNNF